MGFEMRAEQSGFCLKRGENMVKINGKLLEAEGKTLTEYLEGAGYQNTACGSRKKWRNCAKGRVFPHGS